MTKKDNTNEYIKHLSEISGRKIPESVKNRLAETINKKYKVSELHDIAAKQIPNYYKNIPAVLRPTSHINGTIPDNWKPGKKKYFYNK